MTTNAAEGAPGAPRTAEPPATSRCMNEVVRRLKMELVSAVGTDRKGDSGFNPYDRGASPDVWGRRRRA